MDTKRFHNPEYKKQIKAVRTYRRQVKTTPDTPLGKFFYAIGLQSIFRRVLVLLVLALLVYLAYFAKFLQLQKFEIIGLSDEALQQTLVHTEEYIGTYQYGLPQRNIVFFNSQAFSSYILAKDLNVAKVNSIKKKFWNTIIVNLEQRVPAFVLEVNTKSYILNSDGTVGAEILPGQVIASDGTVTINPLPPYPVIKDTAPEEVAPGEYFFSQPKNDFLRFIHENLSKQIAVDIESYETPGKAADQLIVHMTKGFKVLFTNTADPDLYLSRLHALWLQFTPDQQSRLAYIDLRFEKNAYSCFKGDPCSP